MSHSRTLKEARHQILSGMPEGGVILEEPEADYGVGVGNDE